MTVLMSTRVESRDEALARLRANSDLLRKSGVTSQFLFGSAARDELKPDSDIDLFFDYDRNCEFTLFALSDLKHAIEEWLGREVDVMTRSSLHPVLRAEIEASSVQVI